MCRTSCATSGDWFHYSIDYRIGTRYMGEYIADNAKREAMKVPFLRDLLLIDSIYIGSNITFHNLPPSRPISASRATRPRAGCHIGEYRRRQDQFAPRRGAGAARHTGYFIDRAEALYGYPHFVCDTGGSICEWVDARRSGRPDPDELVARTA